jgi:hypothetical protein
LAACWAAETMVAHLTAGYQGEGRNQMAPPNEDLVPEGFAAFGRGDMDALRDQYLAGDIRWHAS